MKTYKQIRSCSFKFTSPGRAKSFALRAECPMMVVMGVCPEYLVTTPADASRLVRMGFEILR